MITLEEFLYLENVKETQSRLILSEYGGIKFESPNDFRKFFESNQVILEIEKIDDRTEKQQLLDRFKSFKTSSDYILAKNYIRDQIELKKELQRVQSNPNVTVTEVTNLLNGITSSPVDPFFNFVIRKILTGTDTGVLPSENLQQVLTNLIKAQSTESYDEVSDVIRDENGRLITYENLYKNKGRLKVPVLDERFIIRDFRYVRDTSFSTLPDAVSSEANVLAKLNEALVTDISAGNDETSKKFLSDLGNLVNENSNSIAGLNAKIKSLEAEIDLKDQVIQTRIDKEIEHEQYIDSIATDNIQQLDEIPAKDETIIELNTQIDSTISNLEEKVTKQLETANPSFDNLSKKLEEQSKKSEENSTKQIQGFQSAISELTKAITPKK